MRITIRAAYLNDITQQIDALARRARDYDDRWLNRRIGRVITRRRLFETAAGAGIACEEVRVPLRRSRRPEVEALTGQQRVPVVVLDGEAICDSRRILQHLDHRRRAASTPAR